VTEKIYSEVKDAKEIISNLCKKYPDIFWTITNPDIVVVLGIENKERSKKNKTLAKIKSVKAEEKTILRENNIPVRYIVTLYYSDWNNWQPKTKQWILFHELLHIHQEFGKMIKHDINDWKILVDKVGVSWINSENLPDLVNDDVKFNLDLRPSMQDIDDEDNDEEDGEDEKE
jgi:predicted metallopeptidase